MNPDQKKFTTPMIKTLIAGLVLPVSFFASPSASALTQKDLGFLAQSNSVLNSSLVPVNHEHDQGTYTLTSQDSNFLNGLAEVLDQDTLTWMEHSEIDTMVAMESAKAACSNLSNGQSVLEVIEESASWVDSKPTSEQPYAAQYAFSADMLATDCYCPEFSEEYAIALKAFVSNVAIQEN